MKISPILVAAMLTGCRSEAPPAPTSEQTDQLDDAEAMLNELSASDDLAANEEGPADRSAGPSSVSNRRRTKFIKHIPPIPAPAAPIGIDGLSSAFADRRFGGDQQAGNEAEYVMPLNHLVGSIKPAERGLRRIGMGVKPSPGRRLEQLPEHYRTSWPRAGSAGPGRRAPCGRYRCRGMVVVDALMLRAPWSHREATCRPGTIPPRMPARLREARRRRGHCARDFNFGRAATLIRHADGELGRRS